MSLALSGADAAHLAAAAGLTYALGFERALRGAGSGQGGGNPRRRRGLAAFRLPA